MPDDIPTWITENDLEQAPTAYRFTCLRADEPEKNIYCGYEGSLWVETPISEGEVLCLHCERRMTPIEGRIINEDGHYVFYEFDTDTFRKSLTTEFRQTLDSER